MNIAKRLALKWTLPSLVTLDLPDTHAAYGCVGVFFSPSPEATEQEEQMTEVQLVTWVGTMRDLLQVSGRTHEQVANGIGLHTVYFSQKVAAGDWYLDQLEAIVAYLQPHSRVPGLTLNDVLMIVGNDNVKVRGTLGDQNVMAAAAATVPPEDERVVEGSAKVCMARGLVDRASKEGVGGSHDDDTT